MVKNTQRPQRPPGQPEELRDGAPTPDPTRHLRATPPWATERPKGQPPITKDGPVPELPTTAAYKTHEPDKHTPTVPVASEQSEKHKPTREDPGDVSEGRYAAQPGPDTPAYVSNVQSEDIPAEGSKEEPPQSKWLRGPR